MADEVLQLDDALRLLRDGALDVEGRLLDASNATLFCTTTLDGVTAACVYKPVAGERPLWDFPDGTLAGREVSTWLVSQATGWDLVPPTVLRDGPFGTGMCQLWVDVDEDVEEGPDVLRVRITAAEARSFVERARRVVCAGRPPCPLCGLPLDPAGHVCPRQNGYRHGSAA